MNLIYWLSSIDFWLIYVLCETIPTITIHKILTRKIDLLKVKSFISIDYNDQKLHRIENWMKVTIIFLKKTIGDEKYKYCKLCAIITTDFYTKNHIYLLQHTPYSTDSSQRSYYLNILWFASIKAIKQLKTIATVKYTFETLK